MPKNVKTTSQLYSSQSVQSLSLVWLFATLWITAQQASLSIMNFWSLPKLMSKSQWRRPTISSSVIPFSSCLQSLPASGSFQMSQFFAAGGQSIGVSASASVLPINIQHWFPLGWTCWISLQFKGLSRVFSNTTVQKHQFFNAQLSLWSNCYDIHDYWKIHGFDYIYPCIMKLYFWCQLIVTVIPVDSEMFYLYFLIHNYLSMHQK